jgi:hypothetical protein
MKPSSNQPRRPSKLSDSLHRQLNSYALAASAAGVGALALGHPAEAKIIYTPTNVNVTNGLGLDLNNDGIKDFVFATSTSNPTSWVHVRPAYSKNLIWGTGGRGRSFGSASALPAGAVIRAGEALQVFNTQMCVAVRGKPVSGLWGSEKKRYLGLTFQINGKAHYGWARLSFSACKGTLTGYAYETIPNKRIIAGKTKGREVITMEPASLGDLAAGSSAIPASRSGN